MGEKMRISEYKGFELWDCPTPIGWVINPYPVQVTCNGEHVNSFANAHDAMHMIDSMDADTVAYHMRRAPATAAAQGEVCRCGYPMADHDADGQCPGDGYLGDDDAEPLELSVHRFIPGLWRVTHVDGVASMELVAEEATDPNEVIRKHLDANKFLDAIKSHRKMYGSGLREAKEAVEAMQYNRPTYAELAAALQQAQRERDAYAVALNAVFVNVEPALIEVAGIHEENMPSDKRALFRVFRIVDGVLQASAQQAANAEGGA